jgi:shikimate kinase
MQSASYNPHVPIFLLGFMGSGKSTVGEELAARLARPFIDLDKRIEALAARTIADIISSDGEERFRQIEHEALREAAQAAGAIIALGGGVVLRPDNRELIKSLGLSVWLDAPFELCWRRIQSDHTVRPLAQSEEEARARYLERLPLYEQAALRIEISESQSASEIAAEILRRICTEENLGLRAGEL